MCARVETHVHTRVHTHIYTLCVCVYVNRLKKRYTHTYVIILYDGIGDSELLFLIIFLSVLLFNSSGFMIRTHFKKENRKENCKRKDEGKKNEILETFHQICHGGVIGLVALREAWG